MVTRIRAISTLLLLIVATGGCFDDIEQDFSAPAAVTNFTAVAGAGQIALTWNNPADADLAGVRIRRSTTAAPSSVTDGSQLADTSGPSYTDTGLTNGTTYFYSLFAFDQASFFSTGVSSGGPDGVAPSVVATIPTPGAKVGISTTTVSLFFSEAMQQTPTENAVTLLEGSSPFAYSTSWQSASTTLVLTFSGGLNFFKTYQVTLTTGALDLSGQPLAAPFVYTFNTNL